MKAETNAKARLLLARSHKWFHNLTPDERTLYQKKYPGTKFADKTKLVVPKK